MAAEIYLPETSFLIAFDHPPPPEWRERCAAELLEPGALLGTVAALLLRELRRDARREPRWRLFESRLTVAPLRYAEVARYGRLMARMPSNDPSTFRLARGGAPPANEDAGIAPFMAELRVSIATTDASTDRRPGGARDARAVSVVALATCPMHTGDSSRIAAHSWTLHAEQTRREIGGALRNPSQILHALRDESGPPPFSATPAGFGARLMPHQLAALDWMRRRERGDESIWAPVGDHASVCVAVGRFAPAARAQRLRGGVLAMDMGLGKTVVTLALVALQEDDAGPTLVVAPVTLLGQWRREIEALLPGKRVYVHHGQRRLREPARLAEFDVVVTSYGVLSREHRASRDSALVAVRWRRAVLDESHEIRRPGTAKLRACMALRATSRWCLTGTPIVACHVDLLNQLAFVGVEMLLDRRGAPSRATWCRLAGYPDSPLTAEAAWMLRRVMFRREWDGELVDALPALREEVVAVAPTPEESEAYGRAREVALARMGAYGAGLRALLEVNALRRFASCGGTRPERDRTLVSSAREMRDDDAERAAAEPCSICLEPMDGEVWRTVCAHYFCGECLASSLRMSPRCPLCRTDLPPSRVTRLMREGEAAAQPVARGSKLSRLLRDLREVRRRGERALVFAQFEDTLEAIAEALVQENVAFERILGGMSRAQRDRALEDFRDGDVYVFLLSSGVCSAGVNLTAASRVFIVDVGLHASTEQQAVGRAWRLGQLRDVVVTRYYAAGTVEERLIERRSVEGAATVPRDMMALV